jgi:hypothetical protein
MMMLTYRRGAPLLMLAVLSLATHPATAADPTPEPNHVLRRALDIHTGRLPRPAHRQRLSSGPLYAALQASRALTALSTTAAELAVAPTPATRPNLRTQGCQNVFTASRAAAGGHIDVVRQVRVNQDCSLRRQAEEVVAINPTNQFNVIVGQNDSRLGYNHCGFDWSADGGRTWGDQTPPFYELVLGDGHVADACSDPSVTFDSKGNAYIGGLLFDINAAANAMVVAKSNAGIGGAFFHSPAPGPFQQYSGMPLGIVANDNDVNILNDKGLMVADANAGSPKADTLYFVWTRFNDAKGDSPIVFSQSTDSGATWSTGVEISGRNSTLCTTGSGETDKNACDQDQGPDPVVGADGTVYVAFSNANNSETTFQQYLVVSCPPTADCGDVSHWRLPTRITDDFANQPTGPDPTTGCESGDQCLPPNGYRLDDATVGSLSVDRNGVLYFVWSDFRNGGANCAPSGKVTNAAPPCDNDVFYTVSADHGVTWGAAVDVTPAATFGPSAQWQSWGAVTPNGRVLWIAYYDRSYGNCERTGCNDITLARVDAPALTAPALAYRRLTTASMPNLTPANNPAQAGFLGDYMWVTADQRGRPYVVWSDTRGLDGAVEEDVYFAKGFPSQ